MAEKPTTSDEMTKSPRHEKTSLLSDSDSHSSKGSRSEHRQKSSLKLYVDPGAGCSSDNPGSAAYVEPTDGSLKLSKVTIDLKNEESSFFEVSHEGDEQTSLLSDSTVSSPGRKSSKAGGREIRLHYNPATRTVDYSRSSSFESQLQLHQACAIPRSQSADCFGQNVDDIIEVAEPSEVAIRPVLSTWAHPSNLISSSDSSEINNLINFERRPVEAWCKMCRKIIKTSTRSRPQNWCLFCMLLCCTFCCALLFMPDLLHTQHKCPDCDCLIAMYPEIQISESDEYEEFELSE